MRMLQKCNTNSCLLVCLLACLLASVSGCASKAPLADSTSNSATKTSPVVSTAAAPVAAGSDNLSAKTETPAGFEKFMGIFTPYRITIQQGNFVSHEMVTQVKEGMTREQVRFLLGTALLTDMFHADRWDYPFRLLKPNGELLTSRVTVFFKQNLVVKIDSGDLPDEKEYLARISDAAIVDYIERAEKPKTKPKAPTE